MPYPDLGEIFHAEARLEFVYASEYYRSVSPELSRKFVQAFDELLEDIKRFPELAMQVHPMGVRRQVMKKFPYKIFYLIEPDAIFIIAIAHESRHPDYWVYRLDEPGRK